RAGRVDHQDQRGPTEGAKPVAPYRVLHLEAGVPETYRAGADQDIIGISERPVVADAGFGDDRTRRIRRQRSEAHRLEIAVARLLEPLEIGAVVGMSERVALAPAHAMADRKRPSRLDPEPRPI